MLISTEGVPKLNGFDSSLVFEDALTSTQTSELGPKRLRWVVRLVSRHFVDTLTVAQAPEMLRKEKENGPPVVRNKKTDVYALGMVRGPTSRLLLLLKPTFTDNAGKHCWRSTR